MRRTRPASPLAGPFRARNTYSLTAFRSICRRPSRFEQCLRFAGVRHPQPASANSPLMPMVAQWLQMDTSCHTTPHTLSKHHITSSHAVDPSIPTTHANGGHDDQEMPDAVPDHDQHTGITMDVEHTGPSTASARSSAPRVHVLATPRPLLHCLFPGLSPAKQLKRKDEKDDVEAIKRQRKLVQSVQSVQSMHSFGPIGPVGRVGRVGGAAVRRVDYVGRVEQVCRASCCRMKRVIAHLYFI
ncbi:hypothetical protein BCR44DRAFT_176938 [Catenaria anguillulae PL171]|uniref:Uncharacterized protein n=1 Tax=Catenaria anguillulae PL171 TaxID=765915 RepID=A0A1Y2H5R4_9FUNG|nr:hypothetical protein BCR44DRAFT_176938 [Catenaria anguillulae PL171]